MEEKIYEVLRKHKLPLKKREELIVDLLDLFSVSDCDIDGLLNDLDKDAQDYNGYEYGLPVTGEWLTTLRATVRTWLQK
jgi:hypothetical protein